VPESMGDELGWWQADWASLSYQRGRGTDWLVRQRVITSGTGCGLLQGSRLGRLEGYPVWGAAASSA